MTALERALVRGVEVVYLVAGNAHPEMARALSRPENEPFARALAALGAHENFALLALAANEASGTYRDIYVHAKIALIDDAFCTIGSYNVATRSSYGDTELNASFWHTPTARALRCELLREHVGLDTAAMDDRTALRRYASRARANTVRRLQREPMQGLAFALDPASYARPATMNA